MGIQDAGLKCGWGMPSSLPLGWDREGGGGVQRGVGLGSKGVHRRGNLGGAVTGRNEWKLGIRGTRDCREMGWGEDRWDFVLNVRGFVWAGGWVQAVCGGDRFG